MTGKSLSSRRRRIVAILAMVIVVGATGWSIQGCAQNTQKPAATQAPSEPQDVDVHVKVDLPDTVTIK